MNIANLLKAADYVADIPQASFGMAKYREGDLSIEECDSVGCALGHLTRLFPYHIEYDGLGEINFALLAENAFDLEDPAFCYCFASEWSTIDDTPEGCAQRMRFTANQGEKVAERAWKDIRRKHKIN